MWSALLDRVFPPRCAACDGLLNAAESGFCEACAVTLLPREASCGTCGERWDGPAPAPERCGACLTAAPPIERSWWAWEYGGAARQAVHRLKYRGHVHVARVLAEGFDPCGRAWDLVAPVPLHRSRLRRRGYNQSAVLARAVARRLDVPVDCRALERRRPTAPQVGLRASYRKTNVRGAFTARRPEKLRGKRVLLIDDVVTTGATARACAMALKRAGVAATGFWSVARD